LRSRAGDGTGTTLHGRPGGGGAHRSAHPPGLSRRQHPAHGSVGHMEKAKDKARLAVDIGGTFTDLALEWNGRRESVKVLTTSRAPEEGVLPGVEQILKLAGLQP